MACVNPDGSLSESAKALLSILDSPMTPPDIAVKLGQPLFKVRSSLREMAGAGLVKEEGESYSVTDEGKQMKG